ncbi:MAG: hypothetical protein AB7D39_14960 [Pseudodesulfovibrio sp.]|uniref:hypothetical protein n=1 Tax=Pseudodesulfovibrio sp. TaxID=2035812 RepID=UPI003D0E3FB9
MDHEEVSLVDLAALSHANQDNFLSDILKKDVAISYRDPQGELVKELPDGKTEHVLEAS